MWGILKNWKLIGAAGLVIVIIVVGAMLVNNHETIERQKSQLANKELMLNQVQGALKSNLEQLETERQARDAADRSYQKSLERKERKVQELSNAIQTEKDNDEKFKQCMDQRLPDSVFDSLFEPTTDSNKDSN